MTFLSGSFVYISFWKLCHHAVHQSRCLACLRAGAKEASFTKETAASSNDGGLRLIFDCCAQLVPGWYCAEAHFRVRCRQSQGEPDHPCQSLCARLLDEQCGGSGECSSAGRCHDRSHSLLSRQLALQSCRFASRIHQIRELHAQFSIRNWVKLHIGQ